MIFYGISITPESCVCTKKKKKDFIRAPKFTREIVQTASITASIKYVKYYLEAVHPLKLCLVINPHPVSPTKNVKKK